MQKTDPCKGRGSLAEQLRARFEQIDEYGGHLFISGKLESETDHAAFVAFICLTASHIRFR